MRKKALLAFGLAALAAVFLVVGFQPSVLGGQAQLNPLEARSGTFAIDCTAKPRAISPLIYGIGGSDNPWATGTTAVRSGGNPTTRYNWELDTWNAAGDWFFKNVGGRAPGNAFEATLNEARRRGVKAVITVPIMGWVAKDATSYSFPVAAFGPQQRVAPEQPDAGNGVSVQGKPLPPGPPTITSVRSTPESVARLVRRIRERDALYGRSVESYILDNEPMLWNVTHRDVHPEPTTYDELLEKTIAYGTAIRRADPEAKIAGPAEWGWQAYHYSALDIAAGRQVRPDRRRHGDVPLIPWYLRQLREYEQRTGVRVLDILDVHFYPMAEGMGLGPEGRTDPASAALRLRSTRSLWDSTYRDESWINERMQVLPLLRQWVAENYPGLGISIGEWDFGAEGHMSGGLATAEALGRFGTEGVTSAYRWGSPAERTPGFWAFRAFRNYDGAGGRFQDWSLPVKGDGTLVSLFASRDDAQRRLVAVLLNLAPLSPLETAITLQGCGNVAQVRGFTYTGGISGFYKFPITVAKDRLETKIAPYSINVLELTLGAAGGDAPAAPPAVKQQP
jgi:hypothetical protein